MEWITLANVQVPSGIPTGGADVLVEAARKVVSNDSVFAPLFVIALGAVVVLAWLLWLRPEKHQRELSDLRKECEDDLEKARGEINTLNNQRFAEMREMMVALNTNTAALNVISQSQADRTASSQQIANSLGELIQLSRANAVALDRNLDAISRLRTSGGA